MFLDPCFRGGFAAQRMRRQGLLPKSERLGVNLGLENAGEQILEF
jgi:hypothetical protein